jgi:hypothetical protein
VCVGELGQVGRSFEAADLLDVLCQRWTTIVEECGGRRTRSMMVMSSACIDSPRVWMMATCSSACATLLICSGECKRAPHLVGLDAEGEDAADEGDDVGLAAGPGDRLQVGQCQLFVVGTDDLAMCSLEMRGAVEPGRRDARTVAKDELVESLERVVSEHPLVLAARGTVREEGGVPVRSSRRRQCIARDATVAAAR